MTTAVAVLKQSAKHIGHREKYNNRTIFNDEFYGRKDVSGAAYPWCAAFTSVTAKREGLRPNIDFPWTAGVAVAFAWYKKKGRIVSKHKLKPGDQIRFTWSHIAWFEKYVYVGGVKYAQTIEGNTSPTNAGSQRDGGGVHRRRRALSSIQYGGRPFYGKTAAKPATKPATKPAAKPAAKPAPGPGTAFPLPKGYYFGPKTGGTRSVSGHYQRKFKGKTDRAWIKEWTNQLSRRGWSVGKGKRYLKKYGNDGQWGDEYTALARAFQADQKISVDGAVGKQTWDAAFKNPVK